MSEQSEIQVPDHWATVAVGEGDVVGVVQVQEHAPRTMKYKGYGYVLVATVCEDHLHGRFCAADGADLLPDEVRIERHVVTHVQHTAAALAEQGEQVEGKVEAAATRSLLRKAMRALGFAMDGHVTPQPDGSLVHRLVHERLGITVFLNYRR